MDKANAVFLVASGTYASVAAAGVPEVRVSRGPTLKIPTSTAFMIVPDDKHAASYDFSNATREAMRKALKPSDCALKVKRVMNAGKNGIKIEAISPDIEKLKKHPNLTKIRLKVVENVKYNPRLIVYGIPAKLTSEEIRDEIIAQNLNRNMNVNLKVIYVYQPRADKRQTNCVLEVALDIQRKLMENGRIYLRYSACGFADHIRVLQCYKCLMFGHIAGNCKSAPKCGHCSEFHEMKDCRNGERPPTCSNCQRYSKVSSVDVAHSATDAKRCPILSSKIKDRLMNINYG